MTDAAARIRHIGQGQLAVGSAPDEVIAAILGSCVAACIWDAGRGIGGMNHVVLPDGGGGVLQGACLMERLIDALAARGARRGHMQAKVFGGANMIVGLPDIGARNRDFVSSYLQRERIPVIGCSLGGNRARQVRFWPATGRARLRLLDGLEGIAPRDWAGIDVEPT